MGLCLIAVVWDWSLLVVILEVAVALGMVIFVHELGHFLVAKLCGVKCEKFYLGFDIYGLKLCKFRWGETEYGIGLLPLGGYVKMLGQEDNPVRLREEIERAKQAADTGGQATRGTQRAGEVVDLKAAEQALFDPRSYLAKSVPKRMAIISAGVAMNVIFAFVCAVIAYRLGVNQVAAVVGRVVPGEAAWKAGLRPGDRIEEISGHKVARFADVMKNISLGDNLAEGLQIVIRRPGVPETLKFNVTPDTTRLRPMIGVGPPSSTTLDTQGPAGAPGSPAALAEPELKSGDRIVKLDDQPIESYAQLHAYLATHWRRPLKVTVQRAGKTNASAADKLPEASKGDKPATTLVVEVTPNPMRQLGLEMAMGPITAVQVDSPAAKAGVRPGDLIEQIDGRPVGDPMTLPERLRQESQSPGGPKTVTLSLKREGTDEPLRVPVALPVVDRYEDSFAEGAPATVPQLGIAYQVRNRVQAVSPGSPAAKAGLTAGDVVRQAVLSPPDKELLAKDKIPLEEIKEFKEITVDFGPKEVKSIFDRLWNYLWGAPPPVDQQNWPFLIFLLQQYPPGSRVALALSDGRTVTLDAEPSSQWFDPDRGFQFEPEEFTETAQNMGQAIELGWRETGESLSMVVAFVRKLGTQISPRALGGPITIAKVAGYAAYEGMASLLIFLTMLSANLAVVNFLPIPVLDGGHMVFLLWEGIRGKPANERVQIALTYCGLVFILGLMTWVIGLEVGLIPR